MRMLYLTAGVSSEPPAPPSFPRVRTDLLWFADPQAGGFLVRDTRTGLRIKMGQREQELCRLLDGTRDAAGVVRDVQERTGKPITGESIRKFIALLAAAGALEGAATRPPGKPAGLVLLQTASFFRRWERRLGFWFTAPVQGVLLILAAAVAGLLSWRLLGWHTWTYVLHFGWWQWTAVMALQAAALVAHECAHGLALTRFGGATGNISFFVTRPAGLATIDVSDIYSLSDLRRKVTVLLAGAEMNLVAATLAVLAAAAAPATGWGHVAAITALLQYLQVLSSVIPFQESDGYYVLTVIADIPNLRKLSRQFVATLLKGPAWERRAQSATIPRRVAAACVLFAAGGLIWQATLAAALVIVLARLAFFFHWI